ncbi:MAG: PKD domain-containing protein [Syntrophomonadaceae bacterium]|nr:PKD domain-containing protein [Syntrophomonadaceae bacterium]
MQRHSLTGLLMVFVFLSVAVWSNPVSADNLEFYRNNSLQATITRLDANHPDVIYAQRYDFKLMEATQDPQTREMASLKWVTRSKYASNQYSIKYKTIACEFQLANYIAVWNDPLSEKGAPGEVRYHRVEVSRNNFVQIFARNGKVNEQVIEEALNREDIIHVRAYIQIYHDYNGNGVVDQGEQLSMIMGNESEIDTKASMFTDAARQDMHSRFQQVLIHPAGRPGPDFFSTPEGSTQWQESYKTCAKRYSGKSGTQIKIPITLRNSGFTGTTSFGANWWGSGWTNPVIPPQNVTLAENGSKTFTFTVTVPAQGKETRLGFICNIGGNTPANELNKNNNITVIEVTSNGLPGTPPGSAEDSKVGYIAVVPCTKTIFTGDYYDFKAYYHRPEASALEVTEQSTWEVSNSSVAKLGIKKGRVQALKPGTLVLSATYKGMTGTADVTVIDEPLPPPPNYSPKADFSISNPTPVEGEKVYFWDESYHEGRQYGESIVSWQWTIEKQSSSSSQNTEATWDEVGTYSITLRVEDQDGDSDSCTKSVVVGPALPAAVIQVDPRAVILGRKININGDQSTAANGRTVKWDEMQWEFTKPDRTKVTFTGRYPTPDRVTTNSLINQTGIWKVRLKVKDSDNNESEWAEDIFTVYPDNPPQARFWSITETLRYSYENNEITIRDLSTPGNPDAALGDEISVRGWTLYYDSNNNGIFTDPGDEIILPGQVKSAQIIQQSGNDPYPKIRFYKTGLYKLELSVTESYLDDWDNTVKPGLSANTDSMLEAEKTTMVINIAPTVAFDIIKKTPVDVQFAVDYSVSDEKYNSLLSADANFKSKLIGSAITPQTGHQRVPEGEIAEGFSGYNPRNITGNMWYMPPVIRNFSNTTTTGIYNFNTSELFSYNGAYNNYYRYVNLNNGTVGSGSYPVAEETTFRVFPVFPRTTFSPDIPLEGYTFNEKYRIVAKAGLLQVYQGNSLISTATDMPRSNVAATFPLAYGKPYEEADFPIAIVSFDTNKTLVLYQNAVFANQTTFESSLITYCINNNTGQIFGKKETNGLYPSGFLPKSWNNYNGTKCRLGFSPQIYPVSGERVIIYASITEEQRDNYPTHTRVHFVNQNTSLIYMGQGRSDDNSYTDVSLNPIGTNYIQYNYVTKNGGSQHYIYNNQGAYVANLPVEIYYTEWRPRIGYQDRTPFHAAVGNNAFGYTTVANEEATIWYYGNGSFKWKKVIDLPGNNPWHIKRTGVIGGGNGCCWRETFSVGSATLFKNYLVVSDTYEGNGTQTLLLNKDTGNIEHIIPLAYAWNDSNNLFLQKRADDGNGIMLYVFNQLQGLKFFNQVVAGYPWDSNNINYAVSVIDNGYIDFSTQATTTIQNLKANHLMFTGIAPPTARVQITQLANAAEGGWWINTNNNMAVPLNELADKIIQAVNEERGADNIVLVDQEVELRADYNDAENDWPGEMQWKFIQDPTTLSGMDISNPQGYSPKHNTTQIVNPSPADGSFASLLTQFDKPGTWKVFCKAKDNPNTTDSYMNHPKAGSKWSNEDANLTVIVHRKPAAYFMVFNSTSNKPGNQLVIQDNSYDPDLQYTDPMNMKGLRVWEWQYRKDGGNWETEYCYDNSGPRGFKSSGNYELRLRVQDNFGAWSDWTDTAPITIVNRPPIADFTVFPNPVAVNHETIISDCSYDPDGDPIVTYDWTIETPSGNDQFTRTNPASFPYTWSADGDYQVTLTVTDSEGLSATTSKTVTVSPKQPPVAAIRIPDEVFTDEWFTADGTGSYAFDGNTIIKAYWQYLKPGAADWTSVHEQDVFALRPGETFLHYPIYPRDREHGQWRIRLLVQDNEGLYSEIAEEVFVVQEGWEVTGQIIPRIGERARKMIITGYAHRKNRPDKYAIDNMTAYLVYLDISCSVSGKPTGQAIEALNMVYDPVLDDFRITHTVPEHVFQSGRWPADGSYYVKIVGTKGTTSKETAAPFDIKGNVKQRLYIKTRSW